MNDNRFNVCILSATLTDVFSNELVRGAIAAARLLDMNLTVMPGKYLGIQDLNDRYEAFYEYQYNVLFSYAAKANFDYIIAPVGTIAYAYNNDVKKKFLDTFKGTPVLCVAADVEGYECLEFDNGSGISSAVDYLAAQGRKHIGIMAGSSENSECIERYEAYRTSLERNGLPFKDSYRINCNMSYECKREAECLLENNPELDAIICINDIIASVVYGVIKERGKEIGKDIAVVGFDDQPFAKELDPPLATVRAEAYQLGKISVEKAFNHLSGINDSRHFVETRFIPRDSCLADMYFNQMTYTLFSGDMQSVKKNLREFISAISDIDEKSEAFFSRLSELLDILEKNYLNICSEQISFETVREKIIKVFGNFESVKADRSLIDSLRENMFIWLMRNCTEENLPIIKKIYKAVKIDFGESRNSAPQMYVEHTHLDNLFVRDSLMFGGNLKESYAEILKRLCNIGSVTSYLYTLEEPIEHQNEQEYPKDVKWLFKSFCYGSKCFNIPQNEQKMDTPEVFGNSKLVSDRARILIASALFTAETQYGLVLLEPENFDFFEEIELVTYQLSSAVRSLDILRNLNKLLTETRLALAMANDYKYIYCIDINTGSYVKYERDKTDKDFSVALKGADFFTDCKRDCQLFIAEEDRSRFSDMFEKKAFLERIDSGNLFDFDYLFVKDGRRIYHRLKTIIGKDENEGMIFIGVTDIDKQKRHELVANKERIRFAMISNALASRYELLYYINAVTGEYTEYTSSNNYTELSAGKYGDDFFADAQANVSNAVYPDDIEMVKKHLQKEVLLTMLDEDKTVNLSYRLRLNEDIQYVNMNAVKMTDSNDEYIIIAINNVTAAKLRELEIKEELFRDSLTGVKNKSAYTSAEKKMDSLIKEGICDDFSIFVFDLNDLKKINDSLGHDEGDKYIKSGSKLICSTFKHSPVFRIGGDEFAAILTRNDYTSRAELKRTFKEQVESNKQQGGVVIAVGSAEYIRGSDTSVIEIFKRADKEMYADKRRLKEMP